jgi:hypothetical protein
MRNPLPLAIALLGALTTLPLDAAPSYDNDLRYEASSAWVDVAVDVEGRRAPLYDSSDGRQRYYLEARRGARYALHITNRSAQRLGVLVTVDGLNAISGELEPSSQGQPGARPGRMYVLSPWDDVTVRGWRTSLEEVRRFTFVDEERSYAVRSDKSNGKLGWIEVKVYRERRAQVWREPSIRQPQPLPEDRDEAAKPSSPGRSREGEASRHADSAAAPASEAPLASRGGRAESFPGTGWGQSEQDPVTVVSFEPEARAADTVTLRYEYRRALVALGILPPRPTRDRLAERERGRDGFARAPRD